MNPIARAMSSVVQQLMGDGRLMLVDGSGAEDVVSELVRGLRSAGGFTQASAYIARTLLASPHVDDLYATDDEIIEALRHIDG